MSSLAGSGALLRLLLALGFVSETLAVRLEVIVVILAEASKEIAENDGKADVENKDLSHHPEVQIGRARQAIVVLRREICDLHEDEHAYFEDTEAADQI